MSTDIQHLAPESLLVVGFLDPAQQEAFFAALRQLDAANALVLSLSATVQRDAAGHPSARKWQMPERDPRARMSHDAANSLLGIVAESLVAQEVPLALSDELLRLIASWLPTPAYAVATVIYSRDLAVMVGALRPFADGHLLYHSLPPADAAQLVPLFRG